MTTTPVVTIAAPIALAVVPAPGGETPAHPRREFFSELFGTEAVVNVTEPTLTPVLPDNCCGTAVIVAPGGGFHGLSINSEGYDVARWLAARGVAAFVLEYRLVPGGEDPVAEMFTKPGKQTAADMGRAAVLAGADGIAAMHLVRSRAADFGVDTTRVGIIGFSAGGNVALRVALAGELESRPDFVAAIYAATRGVELNDLPEGTGPIFLVAATDDQLGLADDSVALYQAWKRAELPAELHLYASGGHGFGMRAQALPSDSWIDRFGDWLRARALMEPS
ncbi:MAG TPA: alpha/beta hydrolase [Acidimicrobiia bacterium]